MTNDEQMVQNTKEHERIEKTLNKISETLHGNGQIGLKTKVDRHEQTLTVIRRVIWGVMGVVCTVGGGLLLAALL